MTIFFLSLCSYLIYSISKKAGGSTGKSAIQGIIQKILSESGIRGVKINNRIINVFKKKIQLLTAAFRNTRGGKCIQKLIDSWRQKSYHFKVFYHELDTTAVLKENQDLRGNKRKVEESLVEEQVKRMKLEEKIETVIRESDKSRNYYKARFKSLARKVARLNNKGKRNRGPNKKMKFTDYTKQHRARVKNNMKQDCQATLSFLGLYNFIATKIELWNENNQQYETINLVEEEELQLTENEPQQLTDDDLDHINLWIYIKDKFHISNEAWHELAMKTKDIPNNYKISKQIKELNANWNLKETPGNAEGVQISFKESLEKQIKRLQENGTLTLSDSIKVKISGDGTNIGKRLKLVNFTYTILNEKNVAMNEKGNYVLAIIKTTEEYDNLNESLADLRNEMSDLKEITVNNCTYNIEYFLGGDWKFLACVCGIGQANQDFACIWCKCPRKERYYTNKKWSITDTTLGARTIKEICEHAKTKKFNCKRSPLFEFIPIDHVIIDTLHLFLRISDNLIELLIRELRRLDSIEKNSTFSSGFCRQNHKHMACYETFLKDIGINFEWKINKDTKKLDYRDLTGPEKLSLFQKVNFNTLIPNSNLASDLELLWKDFMEVIGDLKLNYLTDEAISGLETKINKWFKKFNDMYQAKDVTPYMHALHTHVPEFLKLHKNLEYYTQQGMEKYNDTVSKDYFRSSNHRGITSLQQIFLKKHRIQLLEAAGCERVKLQYKCSNCSNTGHTIKTCTSKCNNCNATTFCGHLVKVDGKYHPRCTL